MVPRGGGSSDLEEEGVERRRKGAEIVSRVGTRFWTWNQLIGRWLWMWEAFRMTLEFWAPATV